MKFLAYCLGVLIFIVYLFFAPSFAVAYDNGDFQYWNTENVTWKVKDDVKLSVEEEFWFGDNAGDFYYQHTDLGVTYSGLADWVDVGANYRSVLSKSGDNWANENRPHLNLNLKTKIADVSLSNRSRVEFRMKRSVEDKIRYRNKTTFKFPSIWKKADLKPYVADELFIETGSIEYTANRLYAGFTGQLTKSINFEIYYAMQSSKSSSGWNEINVLGTKVGLAF